MVRGLKCFGICFVPILLLLLVTTIVAGFSLRAGDVKARTVVTALLARKVVPRKATKINYRSSTSDNVPTEVTLPPTLTIDWNIYGESEEPDSSNFYRKHYLHSHLQKPASDDPADVKFVQQTPTEVVMEKHVLQHSKLSDSSHYPFAIMMQGSAPYIADHHGKIAVIHIPGEQIEDKHLLQDIALCWLLGMKIVIVTAARYSVGECTGANCKLEYPHECHNALKITDRDTLIKVEEEAGYLRTEMERKLNRCLRAHGGSSPANGKAPLEGNVVSGNFYTAQKFKKVRGEDYGYTGTVTETHTENIKKVLRNNDIVLLTTVGMSPEGEPVNVNGYHLAASVASSLQASKLIYMSNTGCAMQTGGAPIQELPLSFAKSITQHHGVTCHNPGFATFQAAKSKLSPPAVELLLHLGWSALAVERGVKRAHIVNNGDGALLEELYTAKNGASTCLYHDDELRQDDCENEEPDEEWEAFFREAAEQGQTVAHFQQE